MSLLSLCLKARLTQSSLGLGLSRLLCYVPSEPLSEGSSDPKLPWPRLLSPHLGLALILEGISYPSSCFGLGLWPELFLFF